MPTPPVDYRSLELALKVRRRPAAISRAARTRVSNDRSRRKRRTRLFSVTLFPRPRRRRSSLALTRVIVCSPHPRARRRRLPFQAESAWQQRARESFYATTPPRVARLAAQWALQSAPFGESLRYTEGAPSEPDVARIGVRL